MCLKATSTPAIMILHWMKDVDNLRRRFLTWSRQVLYVLDLMQCLQDELHPARNHSGPINICINILLLTQLINRSVSQCILLISYQYTVATDWQASQQVNVWRISSCAILKRSVTCNWSKSLNYIVSVNVDFLTVVWAAAAASSHNWHDIHLNRGPATGSTRDFRFFEGRQASN